MAILDMRPSLHHMLGNLSVLIKIGLKLHREGKGREGARRSIMKKTEQPLIKRLLCCRFPISLCHAYNEIVAV